MARRSTKARRTVSIPVEEEFVPFVQAQISVLRSHFEIDESGVLNFRPASLQPKPRPRNALCRKRWYWEIEYRGERAIVKHTTGMPYLAALLGRPGTDIATGDLLRAGTRSRQLVDAVSEGLRDESIAVDAPMLDREAKRQIRDKVRVLQEEADEASAIGNAAVAAQRRKEIEDIQDHLRRAVGKGRRDRRLGSEAESRTNTVVQALRRAIKAIAAEHPALGAHLRSQVQTAAYCSYAATEEVPWYVEP